MEKRLAWELGMVWLSIRIQNYETAPGIVLNGENYFDHLPYTNSSSCRVLSWPTLTNLILLT